MESHNTARAYVREQTISVLKNGLVVGSISLDSE